MSDIISTRDAMNAMSRKEALMAELKEIDLQEKIDNLTISYNERKELYWTRVDGRRQVSCKTKEGLIEKVRKYYEEQQPEQQTTAKQKMTLGQAMAAYNEWNRDVRGKSQGTYEKIGYNCRFFDGLNRKPIAQLNADDLRRYILDKVRSAMENNTPYKKSYIKGAIQALHGTYRWAVEHKKSTYDPSYTIKPSDYFVYCPEVNGGDDNDEDAVIFTENEWNQLEDHMRDQMPNMHAYAVRLAMLTGMRVGEIVALHWLDVHDAYIYIHRQQRIVIKDGKREEIVELPYTKNERGKTTSGRLFPIGPELRALLDELHEITGDGTYVLSQHDHWLEKSSCNAYLRRHLIKLNLHIGNFHAIRKTFNSIYLMHTDLTPVERSMILGHSVEVNERFYSHSRSDTVEDIGRRMYAEQPA